jgi:Pentapeptide repeats (8 copies)
MPDKRETSSAEREKSRLTQRSALWVGSVFALLVAALIALVVAIRMGTLVGCVPFIVVVLTIFIILGYQSEWTGFKTKYWDKDDNTEVQPRKTLWDWMQLLFVPLMIALLAGGLTWWQTSSEHAKQAEEAARQEALRAQNTAIQAYLDQMSSLMLEKHLRKKGPDSEVRTLAQARTTAILPAVESENKRTLLQFLSDTGLVQKRGADSPVLSLAHADLSDANFRNMELGGADLSYADLSGANLSYADLSDADLNNADLQDANLGGADLSGAKLRHAYMSGAHMSGAVGWTRKQLATAVSLEGATMPNGQKYEEWLKDREQRQQDE